MVLLRPPFSSKHCFSLRWLRQCSRALSPENNFSGPPLCSRGLRCSKFSLQRNFQGLLSIVQLSRFLSFFSSDSLYRLSQRFAFVKNFFHPLSTSFFFCLPFFRWPPAVPRSFRLRVSGQPALRSFPPSSATGAILSPWKGIVNVFLVFYLFQTVHAILTNLRSLLGLIIRQIYNKTTLLTRYKFCLRLTV